MPKQSSVCAKTRIECLDGLVQERCNAVLSNWSYSISQEICTRFFALLWLYLDWFSHIHQAYFTGTVATLTIAPVPAKQPWWIWINTSCEFIMNDCITTTKQSTTKPCAYFLGYTVCLPCTNPSMWHARLALVVNYCCVFMMKDNSWARFLSLAGSKLRLCSANHRSGYCCNLPCDWPSTAWAYSEQETEIGPRMIFMVY